MLGLHILSLMFEMPDCRKAGIEYNCNVKYEAGTAGLIVRMWKCVNISAESGQNLHSLAQRSH